MQTDSIDYDKAKEEAEKAPDYPVFAQGLYRCEIIEAEYKPDNKFNGESKPVYSLKLQPIEMAVGGEMMGTDGEKREAVYESKEGKEYKRFFFFTISLPFSLHEKANFGKLVQAIFGNETPYYNKVEDYVGSTVICQIIAKNGGKDGDGPLRNYIAAISTDPKNELKKPDELSSTKEPEEKQPGFDEGQVEPF